MTYLRSLPSPPLNRYIHHLYYVDGPMPFPRERILPVPHLDLKINLGGAFQMYQGRHTEHGKPLAQSWFVGLYGEYHTIDWPSQTRVYGVRFQPSGVYPFFGFPLSEIGRAHV